MATVSAIAPMARANSSSARARISGTVMLSLVLSRRRSRSAPVYESNICRTAARTAAIGPSPGACCSNAAINRVSMSSCRTTSSLVGKYRKNVLGDTSAAAAICSTVVAW